MYPEDKKIWYYASPSNERIGPVTIGELGVLAGQGTISPSTLIWSPEHHDRRK